MSGSPKNYSWKSATSLWEICNITMGNLQHPHPQTHDKIGLFWHSPQT